jgi:hypothetical protein
MSDSQGSNPLEPKRLDLLIEELKSEIKKITDELVALDPDALTSESLQDDNQKLLQETEDLKRTYLELKSQLDVLVQERSASQAIRVYQADFPVEAPPKDPKDQKNDPNTPPKKS